MTLSYGMALTLIIITSIILALLFLFIFFKLTRKVVDRSGAVDIIGVIAGIILGIVAGIYMNNLKTPVVEVHGFDSTEYYAIGNTTFTTSDNQEITVQDNTDECIVVNVTSEIMFIEKLDYGIGFDLDGEEPVMEVQPHGYKILGHAPDFYPWDGAPNEISVSQGTVMASRTWVHF